MERQFQRQFVRLTWYLFAALLALTSVLLGCEEVQQLITPGAPDAVKIGLILEFSLDITTRYGAELAVTEINQAGGILGQPLALIVKDNRDNPELSAQQAESLIQQDGVVAIVGPNFCRNAVAVAPIAQRLQIPMVTTTVTDPGATAAGDFVFLGAFSDAFQGRIMAEFARNTLRAETAAVLIQRDEIYSEGLGGFFSEAFTALGGRIVAREFYAAGDTDFLTPLQAIADVAPAVVFMPGFVPEVPLCIKQARTVPQRNASGITATFLGGDAWDDPTLIPLGGNALENSYFSGFFSPESASAEAQTFTQAYRAMFGIAPDGSAAMGYDAVKLVATAMRRAGSLDPRAIRDQIAATRGYIGATSLLSYDENRHPTKSAVILKVQNGQIRFHQQINP